jgi:hypothetical protein
VSDNLGHVGRHVLRTFTGGTVDLDEPSPDQICVEDIAAGLSKVCRFGAQSTAFHSVAQHAILVQSLVVERFARPDLATWALHHDSHEAYLTDIPRPLKLKLRAGGVRSVYDDVAAALDGAIAVAFGCEYPGRGSRDADIIDRADDVALIVEARGLLVAGDLGIVPKLPLTAREIRVLPELGPSLAPPAAARAFLRAHELTMGTARSRGCGSQP